MAERKRWDKQQQDFQSLRVESTSDAKADPVLTKQLQYIKVLEERNRVKKRLAAASKRSDRLHEREEAFVTAFNVPARAAPSASLSSRNTRSATSVLPTKLPGKREEAKPRSAPSTTLNFAAGGGDDQSLEQNRVRRAKWNRPQAPMGVAVEHQDGVPRFRLTTESEEKGGDDEGGEEESYLEESFEEFEEEEEEESEFRQEGDLVIDEIEDEEEDDNDAKASVGRSREVPNSIRTSRSAVVAAPTSPIDLSRTTKELVGIIQHLSRSEQRALVDVLHKFQSSDQDANDVKVLQSSIGDPAIWKEMTTALSSSASSSTQAKPPAESVENRPAGVMDQCEYPTVAPLQSLLEEHLRWEDEYANEVKERLARERKEKHRILKNAEERRAKMMKQLEDEEREIELLMEVKRQERLAKLRALQEEAAADTTANARRELTKQDEPSNEKIYPETYSDDRSPPPVLEALYIADAKGSRLASDLPSDENQSDAKFREEQVPVIPRLNLAIGSGVGALIRTERYEIQVKLLSTWSKTRVVGLTQLCVYDLNGAELSVDMETLRLYDQQTGRPLPKTNDMVRGLHKLFNGVAQTNSEKDMWLGRLGDSGPLATSFTTASASVLPYSASFEASSSKAAPMDNKAFINGDGDTINAATTTDIPVLPSGKWLQIEILSTWGDPYYVGLNGVEIFDHRGELVRFQDPATQVTACPESINVLEENTDDPRVPTNLIDGVNFTCDDFHMWLAPFTPEQAHYVLLELGATIAVSMVRIWNYNKSRTHTCRGVREARLILYDAYPAALTGISSGRAESGNTIFEGEIRQAPGLVGADSMDISNEVILFTQDATILEAIEANDEALTAISREQQREDEEAREIVASVHRSMELRRPQTSDGGSRSVEKSPKNQENDDGYRQTQFGKDGRPMTMATRSLANSNARLRTSIDSWVAEEPQEKSPVAVKVADGAKTLEENFNDEANMEEKLPYGRRLTLQLHNTWGDRNYIGLTQVEVLVGSRGTSIPLDAANIDATPRDLASLGYVGDPRTLDKLIDGEATTCDDTHMWLVPMEAASVPEVRIEFKKGQYFFGLRIWNYNKSSEDSFRGVKQLTVALDGVVISPKETGFLLRKAPGAANFDFGQLLRFPDIVESPGKSLGNSAAAYSERVRYPFSTRAYKTPIIRQDYEAQLYPQGFLLKIVCWQTWGDPYYLGLNGLELYDFAGARIDHKPAIVSAVPYSVSELDHTNGRQQDTRTPDNLMSGLDKNTWEAHDAWLAPLASSLGNQQGNIVYIGFDTPVVLSMIKFWNYSKTPERGVKDLDIYLDDMHLFSGTLRKAPAGDDHGANGRYSKMHKVTEHFGQPVLFSASQAQVDAEKRNVSYCGTEEQDVLGINEGQVMQESRAMYRKPDPGAEGVVVDLEARPMTAVCRQ
ncbi:Katanin-interacting protein [Phytophthora ramorum]|nr:Katanin-interacting protein [Phytophthora ramorum]